jgi:hypothetical protein
MLTVLGGLAEFERELLYIRTGESRARAKANGISLGRKPKLTPHQKQDADRRRDDGQSGREIARSYNVSTGTTSRPEWCLDILDEMFDHYYVKPEQAKARKATLDIKLAAAGKPPAR